VFAEFLADWARFTPLVELRVSGRRRQSLILPPYPLLLDGCQLLGDNFQRILKKVESIHKGGQYWLQAE
jgi:hypothetical protein